MVVAVRAMVLLIAIIGATIIAYLCAPVNVTAFAILAIAIIAEAHPTSSTMMFIIAVFISYLVATAAFGAKAFRHICPCIFRIHDIIHPYDETAVKITFIIIATRMSALCKPIEFIVVVDNSHIEIVPCIKGSMNAETAKHIQQHEEKGIHQHLSSCCHILHNRKDFRVSLPKVTVFSFTLQIIRQLFFTIRYIFL